MAKEKQNICLSIDGWLESNSDSEESAVQQNGAAVKKRKLSLNGRSCSTTECFQFVNEAKMEVLEKRFVPKNTESSTKWALSTFLSWCKRHNACFNEPENQVPSDLLISTDPAPLFKWLTHFVAEAQRKDGANYPPKTIYLLLTGLLRHMRSRNPICPNFLDTSDPRFSTFHNALDNVLRDLCVRAIGAQTRETEAEEEEKDVLWHSGVLGSENPKSLLRAVFYLNGKNFCLRGGEEQRRLKIGQLQRLIGMSILKMRLKIDMEG